MFHVEHSVVGIKGIVTKKLEQRVSRGTCGYQDPEFAPLEGSQPFQITCRRVIALGSLRVHDASNAV